MSEFEHDEPSAPEPQQQIAPPDRPRDALDRPINMPGDVERPAANDVERDAAEFDAATEQNGDLLGRALSEYELSILKRAGLDENASDYDIHHALAGDTLHKVYGETRDRLLDFAQHLQQTVDIHDFNNALRHVRETQPAVAGISNNLIAAFLIHAHNSNLSFQRDWANRYDNPKGWRGTLERAAKQLVQQIEKPIDEDVTADLAAIAQFMKHGSTKNAPEARPLPKNLTSMPNEEFTKFMKDTFNINSRL